MKVAEAIARTMIDEGIDIVFSLLGEATMHVVDVLARNGVRVIDCRHEAAALAMADGYSRATGKPALCAVTTGPAFAHTLVPLTSAGRSQSQVIVLTGLRKQDDLEDRQRMDHQGIARLAGVSYRPLHEADNAVERTREVMDLAWSTGKPVVLDVSEEVQIDKFDWDIQPRPAPAWRSPQRIHPDPEVLAKAVELLSAAEKPVIVAGVGAVYAGAREELLALAEQTGALVATTLESKGLFSDDEYNAGIAGLYSSDLVMSLFGQSDCMLAFGASLNSHTLTKGYLFGNADIIQIDVRPPAPTKSGQDADLYMQADALAAARLLRQALPTAGPGPRGFRTPEIAQQLAAQVVDAKEFEVEPGLLDPREVLTEIDTLLPAECGFATGLSGAFWAYGALHLTRHRSPMLTSTQVGAIGYGIPIGLGAALANPERPLVCLEGDGSMMMYVNTLETAARHKARMLIVVLNNESLGAEYYKLGMKGLDAELSMARGLDVSGVATALGCRSVTARSMDDVRSFVQEFLAGEGPYVLDVRTSLTVMSRTFRRAYFGE